MLYLCLKPTPWVDFRITATAAEAAAAKPSGNKTFLNKSVANFMSGSVNLLNKAPMNAPDWMVLDISVFKHLMNDFQKPYEDL